MDTVVEIYESADFFIFCHDICALFCNRNDGSTEILPVHQMETIKNVKCIGTVEGILGKLQLTSRSPWCMLLIRNSVHVCNLFDGVEVRRISKIAMLPLSSQPPTDFAINPCSRHASSSRLIKTKETAIEEANQLMQTMQNKIKTAANLVMGKASQQRTRYERQIRDELEKMFEGEGDLFYFSPDGGDITHWTQTRFLNSQREINLSLKPVWHRVDAQFIWNNHIQEELINKALDYLQLQGLPMKPGDQTDMIQPHSKVLKKHVRCLENMFPPVMNGFFECEMFKMPTENALPQPMSFCTMKEEEEDEERLEQDSEIKCGVTAKITIISRRSHLRAGCRYRRRGIDENGHVANYVETEQVLEVMNNNLPHVASFVQLRGSVPVYWSQSGIKYKPSITLDKSEDENKMAFAKHMETILTQHTRLIAVNLMETGANRQENKITKAYIRNLLLYNNPKTTYVGFDFHEYCKGLHFENVSVLLSGLKSLIHDVKYCWLSSDEILCTQDEIFRINCVDCLDRTNLVQSVFASLVIETQLRKLGLVSPEFDLPSALYRTIQSMWANNGDALSRQYTGTVAMKGDFTRTGLRTMNGLMRDGVSSVSRYYQRFGEIKRQAAIDFLLGLDNSPEFKFMQSCPVSENSLLSSNINAGSLMEETRSLCLNEKEESFVEFVAIGAFDQSKFSRDINCVGIVSDRFLHTIRIVEEKKGGILPHIRIPVDIITKISLGIETSMFRPPMPTMRIYYNPPTQQCSETKEKEVINTSSTMKHDIKTKNYGSLTDICPSHTKPDTNDAVNTTESVYVSTLHVNSVMEKNQGWNLDEIGEEVQETRRLGSQTSLLSVVSSPSSHFLDFKQPEFRLFNNSLITVANPDEAIDALQAVAESIVIVLRSIGCNVDLEIVRPPARLEYVKKISPPLSYYFPLETNNLFSVYIDLFPDVRGMSKLIASSRFWLGKQSYATTSEVCSSSKSEQNNLTAPFGRKNSAKRNSALKSVANSFSDLKRVFTKPKIPMMKVPQVLQLNKKNRPNFMSEADDLALEDPPDDSPTDLSVCSDSDVDIDPQEKKLIFSMKYTNKLHSLFSEMSTGMHKLKYPISTSLPDSLHVMHLANDNDSTSESSDSDDDLPTVLDRHELDRLVVENLQQKHPACHFDGHLPSIGVLFRRLSVICVKLPDVSCILPSSLDFSSEKFSDDGTNSIASNYRNHVKNLSLQLADLETEQVPQQSTSNHLIQLKLEYGKHNLLSSSISKKSSLRKAPITMAAPEELLEQQLNHFAAFSLPKISLENSRVVDRLTKRQFMNAMEVEHQRRLICSPDTRISTPFIIF